MTMGNGSNGDVAIESDSAAIIDVFEVIINTGGWNTAMRLSYGGAYR